jgi:hypothetical protein
MPDFRLGICDPNSAAVVLHIDLGYPAISRSKWAGLEYRTEIYVRIHPRPVSFVSMKKGEFISVSVLQ